MWKAVLGVVAVPLCVLLAPIFCGAQPAQPPEPQAIRQPAGELHYADFGDLNPRFSWMKEKPDLTFKVSSIDLGGCTDVKALSSSAVWWALRAKDDPGFYGFDSAEVCCRGEADGRKFVGVAFVVGVEVIPIFVCRVGAEAFSGVIRPLGRISARSAGGHGFEVLPHRGEVSHLVSLGEDRYGETFAVVHDLASGYEGPWLSRPFSIVEEDEGTYLYGLDRRLQLAKGFVEVTGLRFGGTETITLFQERLPCDTESCDSPEELAPAVKRLDTYLQGKKLLPIRME